MKILLLSDIPPSKAFSGSLFTDRLCTFLPDGTLAGFIILNPALKDTKVSDEASRIPIEYADKPNDFAVMPNIARFGLPFKLLSSALTLTKEIKNSVIGINKIVNRIIDFAEKNNVDRIWCIIQGQSLIRIAYKLLKKTDMPLLTQIWDPPDWWLRAHQIDHFTKKSIIKKYEYVLRHSKKVAAISDIMEKEYRDEYAADTVAVMPSLNKNDAYPAADNFVDNSSLSIGIAGQIYAMENWNALISALDKTNWQIKGREIILRVLGYGLPPIGGHMKRHIEFLGYRSQEEATKILSRTDLLYMPYWFDPAFKKEARLCFPSKLTTYFLSGRPVFCHAPDYTSPSIFLKKHNAAFLCNSLDPDVIIKEIENIFDNENKYAEIAKNAGNTFIKHLSLAPLRKSFAEFLGVDENELLEIDR